MKIIRSVLLAIFFVFLFPTNIFAQNQIEQNIPNNTVDRLAGQDVEFIEQFDVTLQISADGTIKINERIRYNFGTRERHGIRRTIPTTKTNTEGNKFVLTYTDISVTDEKGVPYHVSKTWQGDELELKVGDADRVITGVHMYDIRYTVSGAITYFSDHDELYWNVTGNAWEVPIAAVAAQVYFPDGVTMNKVTHTCFTGALGSNQSFCATAASEKKVTIRSESELNSQEGLTAVIGFPMGLVAYIEPVLYKTFFETIPGYIVLVFLAIVSLLWFIVLPIWIPYRWWKVGRDPQPAIGVASAWFEGPKTKSGRILTPAETGTLIDESADLSDISATIVDLARRGYLAIIETKKTGLTLGGSKFSLAKKHQQSSGDRLEPFEQKLLDGLFDSGDHLDLTGKNLSSMISDVKDSLYESVVREGMFDKNPQTTRVLYEVLAVLGLFTFNFQLVLSAAIFGRAMPKKTLQGAQALAQAKALKNFVTSQDKQFAFQAKHKMLFEKLLPYAVAFGAEKIWAERFKHISMPAPSWYSGYGGSRFNSVLFVGSLSSSMKSFRTAATPTHSSSGFSSGFSGGSSGGGGGGGGGGSW